ncbi:3-hydroxylacyl-ACP dehydratase [Litorilituus lipolyticus]|uniref:3-hydroxylacyl-ACP dehydratase n=1 Tax=Litorilituus lipolyticus TaxID=2491017 RepID=A0A502KRK3_9GAMM|nr:3-hydroxylacyl-ACP dehydratase [Litorilituus lipolyticus]TPH12243.1 3-hydroxylacyl-ACP dehydratase [Litorilituus lipolyticus]
MKKNTYAIEHVVPHAHPMILIDELLEYDDSKALCQLTITENSNFYNSETQSVPNYVAIEYMAQSIAAFANANEKDQGGEVSIGFLVSSRKLKVLVKEFSLASTLLVTVEQLYSEENGLSAFDCIIEQAGQIVVEAKINIFQPNDAKAFLAEQ